MIFRQTRHIILLVFLTGLALFLTKGFWFCPSEKAVRVSFTSQADRRVAYQVFYTTSQERSFNSEEKVTHDVEAGKQQVRILLPVEKILRFRLDLGQFPQEVTLSDLKVIGDKTVVMGKLSDFILHQIDSSKQDGKFFRLTSNQQDPYLIYKSPLNLSAKRQVRIDYYIFFIILVISLLSAHKIVQYLAQFKFKEKTSRIDIVFVTVFFALLFIPMMKISDAEKSDQENRMLAKYVPFIKEGQINLKYSTNFESWYNDRFFGREFLVGIYHFLERSINPNRGNKNVLVGKDGWLFFKRDNSIENYQNIKLFTKEELKRAAYYLNSIEQWARKNGKDFYYVISPDKNKIYGEYFPSSIYKTKPDSQSRANQLIQYLRENTQVKVIYLADVLKNHKEDGLLYYKNDTHWNSLGSYIGYLEIMKEMKKKYPELPVLENLKWKETTHTRGDLTNLLGSSEQDLESIYLVSKLTPVQDCKVLRQQGGQKDMFCRNPEGKLRLTLRGDSFSTALLDYLRHSFKETESLRRYNFTKQDLENIKQNSDIIIIETVERYIPKSVTPVFPVEGE